MGGPTGGPVVGGLAIRFGGLHRYLMGHDRAKVACADPTIVEGLLGGPYTQHPDPSRRALIGKALNHFRRRQRRHVRRNGAAIIPG